MVAGDQTGKDYLVKLSRDEQLSSFTIPTAYLGEGIASLPIAERYVIKPVDGLSTLGISVATRQGLEKLESELSGSSDCNLIVQPEMSFNAERSFFFIDGKFQYCLDFKPSKIPDWPDPELVEPIDETLQVAEKFVEWNGMSRGVQRIDTILLDDGSVRLLEIEDFTPYLSLLELPEEIREKGLKALVDSVRSYCDEVSSTSLDASEE